jgi:hypothetical protein
MIVATVWLREYHEWNQYLSTLGSPTGPQFIHMVIEPLYAHCPRKPKEPNSMKDCPSM